MVGQTCDRFNISLCMTTEPENTTVYRVYWQTCGTDPWQSEELHIKNIKVANTTCSVTGAKTNTLQKFLVSGRDYNFGHLYSSGRLIV